MQNRGGDQVAENEVIIKDESSKRPTGSYNSPIASLDGGYGWIIVLASFCANAIVDGIIFTTGETLVEVWELDFKTTAMQASIAQSLLTGFYLLAGPLASALANLYGCRSVVIGGALTTFSGFILSSFVSSLPLLYITFGVTGGIGFGLVYLPSIVIVNQYFEKRRALAMGIAVCGSGIGTTIFSQVFPFLLKFSNNSWRRFLIYVAMITLLSIICGVCYRKVPMVTSPVNDEAEKTALIISEKKPSLEEKTVQDSENTEKLKTGDPSDSQKRSTAPGRITNLNVRHLFHSNVDVRASVAKDKKTKSECDLPELFDRRNLRQGLSAQPNIFYPGSMSSLQERISRRGSRNARDGLMMTTTTTTQVIPQRAKRRPALCIILRSMVDISLLSNPSFLLIAVTGFLTLCCLFVPFIFLGKQAVKVGATPREQSYLVLSMGIVNILGRIFCGLISDLPKVDPLLVHNVAVIGGGLATCSVPLLTQYWMYIVYTIPFAWGVACFSALRSIICVELLGLEKLSNAFGMMMLCMGVAALIGPPVAALLKDLSGNFDISFYLMGALLTLSGVLCIPLRMVNSETPKLQPQLAAPPDEACQLEMEPVNRVERF